MFLSQKKSPNTVGELGQLVDFVNGGEIQFKDEKEVLRLANDTKHGLAAGIFSSNSARCLRMSRSVRAGIVWVNTYRVVSPIAEFGGFKNSGYGRESGFQAIYDYTRPKTIWMNMSDEPAANPFVMR